MTGTVKASYRYSTPVSNERNAAWSGLELGIEAEEEGMSADDALVASAELTERLKMEVFRQLGVAFEFVDGVVIPIIPVNDIPVVRTTGRSRITTERQTGEPSPFDGLATTEYDGATFQDTRSLKGTVFSAGYPDFRSDSGQPVWIIGKDGEPTELGAALVAAFDGVTV